MKLVIVESPTKANTISNFLTKDFIVASSYGHVRDLPKSKLAIDVENDFQPQYIVPKKAQKIVSDLKKKAAESDTLILATDEDREGEAIAWHLLQALRVEKHKNIKKIQRIAFHEITKSAIEKALNNPREIDENLVNAQQARRILDRLVGYKLSPFLWKKLMRGLSAGRVQSVALRLIVDREKEIRAFNPKLYWTIIAAFASLKNELFETLLIKINNNPIAAPGLDNKEEVEKIINSVKNSSFVIQEIETREIEKKPLGPFTTSTLQQAAWQQLRFSAKKTMLISQQLYEGVKINNTGSVGLITYMRTDSLNIAEEALKKAKDFLQTNIGESYCLAQPRRFKTKSRASQEAHEAIRPTDPFIAPDSIKNNLTSDQYKIYKLIWQRFVASQMPNAIFNQTVITIEARALSEKNKNYTFQARGSVLKFDGFLKIYPSKVEENILPAINKNDDLKMEKIEAKEHQTEPPPRYSEASLIKALEKFGIGRPSTYAPIISTISGRGYVDKNNQKQFVPSEIGEKVSDILVENFPEIVDINFTAGMEDSLDDIAENKKNWVEVIRNFYNPFAKNLEEKYESVQKQNMTEPTGEACDKCGKPMVTRYGRFGKFIACSGFPECKNTKEIPRPSLNIACPLCKESQIAEKRTKKGRIFYGCSNWPKCNFATWQKPTGKLCIECSSPMIEFRGQEKCSNKNCGLKQTLTKTKKQ